ncbi:MAG: Metalloenzyme, LuxS/M16 peptidase-like protein, partial [Olpidium bornovanus]
MLLPRAGRPAQAACRRDAPPVVLRCLLSLAADVARRIAPAPAAAVLPARRHFRQPCRLGRALPRAEAPGAHDAATRGAVHAGFPAAGGLVAGLSAPKRRLLHARAQPAANSSAAPPAAASTPAVLRKGGAARTTNVSKDGFTAVTTLANGLRVATENTPGHFAALGIYIDAGSRYETEKTRGCSHLMDRLAFKGTENRTIKDIQDEAQSLGGNITCTSSRETIIYQAAVFKDDVPQAFSLLADVVRNLKVSERDVDEQRETALYEITDLAQKPESLLPEYLHLAAYKDNTLGLQLLCDPERLAAVQLDDILFYRETFYRPSRIVVAACGVDHAQVVKLAEKELGDWHDPEYPLAPEASSERVAAVVASTPDRMHLGEEAKEAFAEL